MVKKENVIMISITLTDFRKHLYKYIDMIEYGKVDKIEITKYGSLFATVEPCQNNKQSLNLSETELSFLTNKIEDY